MSGQPEPRWAYRVKTGLVVASGVLALTAVLGTATALGDGGELDGT